MKPAIVKHSIVLDGHKTSVSLESEFWDGLHAIADQQKTKLSKLIAQIDRERQNANLSSAIRVFVYNFVLSQTKGGQAHESAPAAQWPAQTPMQS